MKQMWLFVLLNSIALHCAQEQQGSDPLTSEFVDASGASPTPCSCDCCQAVRRLPADRVYADDGSSSSWKCGRPEGGAGSTAQCGDQCQASSADSVLTSAQNGGQMDYDRYCLYKCKPTGPVALGNICVRLEDSEIRQVEGSDGNGHDAGLSDKDLVGPPSTTTTTTAGDAPEQAEVAAPEVQIVVQTAAPVEEQQIKEEKLKAEVKYDYRKIIAERLRAEAGAAMAHGAAAGERVHRNEYFAKRNALLAKKVMEVVTPQEGPIDEAVAAVEDQMTKAQESQDKSATALADAKRVAMSFKDEVKKLTKEAIDAQGQDAAKEEAKEWALMHDYDKPDFYAKVLAVRASDPYMYAETTAIQRTSEYDSLARGLFGQAQAAFKQAQAANVQANAMEASGDKIGAVFQRHNLRKTLASAKSLEAQAKAQWKLADNTRLTIPKWQEAGVLAAQRISWEYMMLHTPMPSLLQMPEP